MEGSGQGIEPENLGRIFGPFFSTKFIGRGLGLAVVMGMVRGLEGAIRIESHPGLGTSFTLMLPPNRR